MISVYASNVAACIGRHTYKKTHAIFEEMWKKIDLEGYRSALKRHKMIDDVDRLAELVKEKVFIRDAITSSRIQHPDSSQSVTRALHTVAPPDLIEGLDRHDAKIVREKVRENLYTDLGIRGEDGAFDVIQGELYFPIKKCVDTFSKTLGNHKGTEYRLVGKIDAISEDETAIIEIKNRVRRLFDKVVDYEYVQIQAYLNLVPSASSAVLVECLRHAKNAPLVTNTLPVDRDDREWTEHILPRLRVFCEYLIDVINDTTAQDNYLSNKNRERVFQKLFEDVGRV